MKGFRVVTFPLAVSILLHAGVLVSVILRLPRTTPLNPEVFVQISSHKQQGSSGKITPHKSTPRQTKPANDKILANTPIHSGTNPLTVLAAGAPSYWIIGPQKPDYPPVSRLRSEEGTVVLSSAIDPSGAISNTEILQSSGFPRLDRAAIKYLNSVRIGFSEPIEAPLRRSFSIGFRLTD